MGGAIVSLLMMALAGRELAAEISIFEILFFRNAICLVVIFALLGRIGWRTVRSGRLGLHVFRNIVHYGGQWGWFYGITLLPLAEVTAIEFTTPVWTAILAALFLRERLTPTRIVAVALGFTGILIILQPGIAIIDVAAFAVLGSAVAFAATFVVTKSLTTTEQALTILFYMNLVQLPLSLVPSLFVWATPSLPLWPWVLVTGMAGLGSHYCFARAFALADATIVAPLDFLRLPMIAVIGFLAYGESLDFLVLLGAVVIFVGNLLNVWRVRDDAAGRR